MSVEGNVHTDPPGKLTNRPCHVRSSIAVLLALALHSVAAEAQEDFRRGDANVDGVVDVSDVSSVAAGIFLAGKLPCLAAADTNGDGVLDLTDTSSLMGYLFLGEPEPPDPGPGEPGPDPQGAFPCTSYAPAAPAKLADVAFGFEVPVGLNGKLGSTVTFDAAATITTSANTSGTGISAWSMSIAGRGLSFLSATTSETVAAETGDEPPGLVQGGGFALVEVVDPTRDRGDGAGPQGPGLVAAVALDLHSTAALPPEGTVRVLRFTARAIVPPIGMGGPEVQFVDGKVGSGQRVRNAVTMLGTSQVPHPGFSNIVLHDCNANGRSDDQDIRLGSSQDCGRNGIPDECESEMTDCNANGIRDECEIDSGVAADCNRNGTLDACDLAAGVSDDCDADGLIDGCEILGRVAGGRDCNHNRILDSCDTASGTSTDANADGEPDECEGACGPATGSIACPGDGKPVFRYTFRGPCEVSGTPGSTVEFEVLAQIETHCLAAGERGASSWVLGIETIGCVPVEATLDRTWVQMAGEWPGGNTGPAYLIDPARNAGRAGLVSFFVPQDGSDDSMTLPPEGSPHDVVRIILRATIPADEDHVTCTLAYVNGLELFPNPLQNTVSRSGYSHVPEMTTWEIRIGRQEESRFQRGNANADAQIDVSDAIFTLGCLFLGTACATCADAADANDDGTVDLSDGIFTLSCLFLGQGCPPLPDEVCGPDPTADELSCGAFSPCAR